MSGEYKNQWQEYMRRHWAATFGLVLGLPAATAIAILLKVQFGFASEMTLALVMSVWAAIWGWLAFRVARFPCPRCGSALDSNRVCEHCGLSLYEGS